jgi:uncharacterized RDD family membrane protein YckC
VGEVMWHYAQGGASEGPVPHARLCALFAGEELPLDTHVWRPGMSEWAEASTVEEFRGVFGRGFGPRAADPPPLPANARGRLDLTPIAPAPATEIALGPPLARASLAGEMDRATRPRDQEWTQAPLARPWVRWWARWLDMWLLTLALVYAAPQVYTWPRWQLYLVQVGVTGLAVLAYALQLCLFGTTAGKAILGITVRSADGRRPTFAQAFERELLHWVNGQALCIPLLNVVAAICGYSTLKSEGASSWDRAAGLVVRHRDVGLLRSAAYVIVVAVVGAATFSNNPTPSGRRFREYLADAMPRRTSPDAISITGSGGEPEWHAAGPQTQPLAGAGRSGSKPRLLTLPSEKPPTAGEPPSKVSIKPVAPTSRPSRPARPQPRVASAPPAD